MAIPIPTFSLILRDGAQGIRMLFTSGRVRKMETVFMKVNMLGATALARTGRAARATDSVWLSR